MNQQNKQKQYKVGYTQGVYDMFHIGHLNLINRAKEFCDYLIVGVNADKLVLSYKHKMPVINEKERRIIVSNIRAVNRCVIATTLDKVVAWKELRFNAIFIGDDWRGMRVGYRQRKNWSHMELGWSTFHILIEYLLQY